MGRNYWLTAVSQDNSFLALEMTTYQSIILNKNSLRLELLSPQINVVKQLKPADKVFAGFSCFIGDCDELIRLLYSFYPILLIAASHR